MLYKRNEAKPMNPFTYAFLVLLVSFCLFGCLASYIGTDQPYFDALVTLFVSHWILRDLLFIQKEPQKPDDSDMRND